MFGKTVYLVAFLVSFGIVANAAPEYLSSSPNNPRVINIGQRVDGDRLILENANLDVDPKLIENTTAQWNMGIPETDTITMVRLVDKSTDGQGVTVEICEGGPGFNRVKFRFRSGPRHGIYYEANVYGKKI